jgi:hypothetical protein
VISVCLLALLPQEQVHVAREQADLEAFGLIDAEFALASAAAGPGAAAASGRRDAVLPGLETVIGRWLQAVMAGQREEWQRWQARMNGGRPGWSYDEAAVVQAACELAAWRRWGGDGHGRDISEGVAFIREASQSGGMTRHDQREIEAVIGYALGQADVDISHISRRAAFEIHAAVTMFAATALAWPPPQIGALLAAAEQLTAQRGWKPPPAPT